MELREGGRKQRTKEVKRQRWGGTGKQGGRKSSGTGTDEAREGMQGRELCGRSEAYMRCVLSGVQSGRYLAPSSRALSRSSERKGFWKPLSTTTTPCRILPSSWGPARAPLGSVPSPWGFPGTALCAGAEAGAAAGVRLGTGNLGLLGVGGPAEGLLGGFLSSRFKSSFLFPLRDS